MRYTPSAGQSPNKWGGGGGVHGNITECYMRGGGGALAKNQKTSTPVTPISGIEARDKRQDDATKFYNKYLFEKFSRFRICQSGTLRPFQEVATMVQRREWKKTNQFHSNLLKSIDFKVIAEKPIASH